MAKCNGCGKFISPSSTGAASCGFCSYIFHKGCVSLPDSASVSKDWQCPECKAKARKGDNSSTPVKNIAATAATDLPPPPDDATQRTVATDAAAAAEGIRELRRELSNYVCEMREFRQEMAEFRLIVASASARIDGMERRLEELEKKEATAAVGAAAADVAALERTVGALKQELADRDQEALLSDLEIGHLPEEKGENVVHAVTVLAAKLGVKLEERDIVFAERVGAAPAPAGRDSSPGPRSRRVVVRVARRALRDSLLRGARVRRTLTAADTGCADSAERRIFINERLTRANRVLFHRVREECKRLQWRYSWTKRGRIYVRQSDGGPAYPVRSEADVLRVFGSKPV